MNLKKLLFSAVLGLTAAAVSASSAVIKAPLLKFDGKPGSILNSSAPEYGDFKAIGTKNPAAVKTFYKVFHDNKNLYVAIKAMEPTPQNMVRPKLTSETDPIWRSDVIELNFIHRNDETRLYKLLIDSNGFIADCAGEDDNTGLSRFVMDYAFASCAKVISCKVNKDNWTLELAIPLGAFNDSSDGKFRPLNLQVGRTRMAERNERGQVAMQMSSSHATNRVSFSDVRTFVPLELANFDDSFFAWQLNDPAFKTYRSGKDIMLDVKCSVVNKGKRFSFCKIRGVLLDRDGNVVATADKSAGTQANRMTAFTLPLKVKANGSHRMRLELRNAQGHLLSEKYRTVIINYQGTAINLITPWYRDNIYATMPKINKIEAEIVLEENIGQPMEVKLTGPNNFAKSIKIAKTKKVNPVSFDFVNMPDGDYYITAGKVSKRIRKLPFRTGEVWLDRKGVLRREGKKYLPLGVMGMTNTVGEGLNINLTFVSPFRSPELMKAYFDQCAAVKRPAWIYPYHRFPVPYTYNWAPFSAQDMLKASLNDEQKKILANYVKLVDNHPGFFGHYLADEPEGRNENPLMLQAVHDFLRDADPYHPTLINHYGVDGVAKYKGIADIVGLDCYWDTFKDNKFNYPPDISYRNAKIASEQGKCLMFILQAFDWGHTNRFGGKSRAPTFDEMRAQMYMAFLGNARGIVPFSYSTRGGSYSNELRIGTPLLMKEPAAMTDVLLERSDMNAVKAPKGIIAGVKRYQDTFVIIAVNPTFKTISGKIQANFALPATMKVSGEKRSVQTSGNAINDTFKSMDVHIYISGNIPADAIDLAAVRAQIKAADASRIKPGNLAAAGELGLAEIYDYKKGIIPPGVAKASASSSNARDPQQEYAYFLQDGLRETQPINIWTVWSPVYNDAKPWVQYDFGKKVKFSKLNVWSASFDLKRPAPVIAAEVQIEKDGKWVAIAKLDNNKEYAFSISFPAVEADKVRLQINRRHSWLYLSEVEVMK